MKLGLEMAKKLSRKGNTCLFLLNIKRKHFLTSEESWNCVDEDVEETLKRTGEDEGEEDAEEDERRVISELE